MKCLTPYLLERVALLECLTLLAVLLCVPVALTQGFYFMASGLFGISFAMALGPNAPGKQRGEQP